MSGLVASALHLAAIAALIAAAISRGRSSAHKALWYAAPLLWLASLAVTADMFVVQKYFGRLAMPLGLVWLALLFLALHQLMRGSRRLGLVVLGLFAALWLACNTLVGSWLIYALERDYHGPLPLDEPYDAVMVLGGGTTSTPAGPKLTFSGDRVATAARLYHAGKTTRVICSGYAIAALSSDGQGRSLGDESRVILNELGIDAGAIDVLDDPRNTSEEIAALAALIEARGYGRVGLVTSAWHMRRAMRHAARHELALTPLVADFRGGRRGPNILDLLPNGNGAFLVRSGAWELLGMAVGR